VRTLARNGLHLAVLSAFAFAQPLFDLLGKYPAFWAAHDSTRWEIVGFALVLVLVPPLVLLAVEALAGLAGEKPQRIVHLVFIGLLAAIVAMTFVRRIESLRAGLVILGSLAIGAQVAALYARVDGVRSFLSVLGPAPLLFLCLFLFTSESSTLVTKGSAEAFNAKSTFRPPIVFITFDAFDVKMLENRRGDIDAKRFPNFAALSKDATWYRNASTVHENTVFAVPAILDGNVPKKGTEPIAQDHPNNLFSLLGKTYEMNVAEEATSLCPPGVCRKTNRKDFQGRMKQLGEDVSLVYQYLIYPERSRARLPQITDRWAGFREKDVNQAAAGGKPSAGKILSHLSGGRVGRFRRALRQITASSRPQLNFAHVFFPHEPRQYLPHGKEYQSGPDPDPSLDGPPSYDNEWLTHQAEQRTVLQVGFTDSLVGELVARLKQLGIYDKTLIVIVADHGESFDVKPEPAPPFTPGKLGYRRAVTPENVEDIASIPLFIKYPDGQSGKIDERFVRTIDILPTIGDVLGVDMPFKPDGKSLRDESYRGIDEIKVEKTAEKAVTIATGAWTQRREASLARRIGRLGDGDMARAYRLGPNNNLIGRSVSELSPAGAGGLTATVQEPERFGRVDLRGSFLPAHVAGRLSGGEPAGHDLAVALNGTIVAVGRSFKPIGKYKVNWSVVLPEDAFRQGANKLEVFEVTGGTTLRRLGGAA
jgi:hypothetical protein